VRVGGAQNNGRIEAYTMPFLFNPQTNHFDPYFDTNILITFFFIVVYLSNTPYFLIFLSFIWFELFTSGLELTTNIYTPLYNIWGSKAVADARKKKQNS